MLPPLTVISLDAKLVVTSLLVKVTVKEESLVEDPLDTVLEPSTAVIFILGAVVSIINALLAPNEFVVPGADNVNVATFPAASLMEPLFSANALVLI